MTSNPYTLYQMPESGNCYKVRLLLNQIGQAADLVHIDILQGQSRNTDFLDKNYNGRVPLLKLPDGCYLPESNAILWYLAEDTAFLSEAKFYRAQILQWMFFEQYSHEPYIATSRYWISILNQPDKYHLQLEEKQQPGYEALGVMERHLSDKQFFVNDSYSIADICLYAYTHVAHEGNFDLTDYPATRRWITRVAEQPAHIKITD